MAVPPSSTKETYSTAVGCVRFLRYTLLGAAPRKQQRKRKRAAGAACRSEPFPGVQTWRVDAVRDEQRRAGPPSGSDDDASVDAKEVEEAVTAAAIEVEVVEVVEVVLLEAVEVEVDASSDGDDEAVDVEVEVLSA